MAYFAEMYIPVPDATIEEGDAVYVWGQGLWYRVWRLDPNGFMQIENKWPDADKKPVRAFFYPR